MNLVVLGAFVGAAVTLYTIVDNSGILRAEEPATTTTSTTVSGVAGLADIPPDHPQAARIKVAVEEGLVAPARPGTFEPGGAMTRGDVALAVVKAAGWPVEEGAEGGFSDVTDDPEALDLADYVAVAVAHGVFELKKSQPPVFEPDVKFTVRALVLAMGAAGGDDLPAIDDVRETVQTLNMTGRQKSCLEWLLRVDALEGTDIEPGVTDLEAPVTRLQVAVMAANIRALAGAQ